MTPLRCPFASAMYPAWFECCHPCADGSEFPACPDDCHPPPKYDASCVIVLDLDHTLVHTVVEACGADEDFDVLHLASGWVSYVRPFVREFFALCFGSTSSLTVGFWTAGTSSYAREIVSGLFDLCHIADWRERCAFVLSRDDATCVSDGVYVKDLRVVASMFPSAENILLLDDSPVHGMVPFNRPRMLYVPAFDVHHLYADEDDFLMSLVVLYRAKHARLSFHRPTPCYASPAAGGRLSLF